MSPNKRIFTVGALATAVTTVVAGTSVAIDQAQDTHLPVDKPYLGADANLETPEALNAGTASTRIESGVQAQADSLAQAPQGSFNAYAEAGKSVSLAQQVSGFDKASLKLGFFKAEHQTQLAQARQKAQALLAQAAAQQAQESVQNKLLDKNAQFQSTNFQSSFQENVLATNDPAYSVLDLSGLTGLQVAELSGQKVTDSAPTLGSLLVKERALQAAEQAKRDAHAQELKAAIDKAATNLAVAEQAAALAASKAQDPQALVSEYYYEGRPIDLVPTYAFDQCRAEASVDKLVLDHNVRKIAAATDITHQIRWAATPEYYIALQKYKLTEQLAVGEISERTFAQRLQILAQADLKEYLNYQDEYNFVRNLVVVREDPLYDKLINQAVKTGTPLTELIDGYFNGPALKANLSAYGWAKLQNLPKERSLCEAIEPEVTGFAAINEMAATTGIVVANVKVPFGMDKLRALALVPGERNQGVRLSSRGSKQGMNLVNTPSLFTKDHEQSQKHLDQAPSKPAESNSFSAPKLVVPPAPQEPSQPQKQGPQNQTQPKSNEPNQAQAAQLSTLPTSRSAYIQALKSQEAAADKSDASSAQTTATQEAAQSQASLAEQALANSGVDLKSLEAASLDTEHLLSQADKAQAQAQASQANTISAQKQASAQRWEQLRELISYQDFSKIPFRTQASPFAKCQIKLNQDCFAPTKKSMFGYADGYLIHEPRVTVQVLADVTRNPQLNKFIDIVTKKQMLTYAGYFSRQNQGYLKLQQQFGYLNPELVKNEDSLRASRATELARLKAKSSVRNLAGVKLKTVGIAQEQQTKQQNIIVGGLAAANLNSLLIADYQAQANDYVTREFAEPENDTTGFSNATYRNVKGKAQDYGTKVAGIENSIGYSVAKLDSAYVLPTEPKYGNHFADAKVEDIFKVMASEISHASVTRQAENAVNLTAPTSDLKFKVNVSGKVGDLVSLVVETDLEQFNYVQRNKDGANSRHQTTKTYYNFILDKSFPQASNLAHIQQQTFASSYGDPAALAYDVLNYLPGRYLKASDVFVDGFSPASPEWRKILHGKFVMEQFTRNPRFNGLKLTQLTPKQVQRLYTAAGLPIFDYLALQLESMIKEGYTASVDSIIADYRNKFSPQQRQRQAVAEAKLGQRLADDLTAIHARTLADASRELERAQDQAVKEGVNPAPTIKLDQLVDESKQQALQSLQGNFAQAQVNTNPFGMAHGFGIARATVEAGLSALNAVGANPATQTTTQTATQADIDAFVGESRLATGLAPTTGLGGFGKESIFQTQKPIPVELASLDPTADLIDSPRQLVQVVDSEVSLTGSAIGLASAQTVKPVFTQSSFNQSSFNQSSFSPAVNVETLNTQSISIGKSAPQATLAADSLEQGATDTASLVQVQATLSGMTAKALVNQVTPRFPEGSAQAEEAAQTEDALAAKNQGEVGTQASQQATDQRLGFRVKKLLLSRSAKVPATLAASSPVEVAANDASASASLQVASARQETAAGAEGANPSAAQQANSDHGHASAVAPIKAQPVPTASLVPAEGTPEHQEHQQNQAVKAAQEAAKDVELTPAVVDALGADVFGQERGNGADLAKQLVSDEAHAQRVREQELKDQAKRAKEAQQALVDAQLAKARRSLADNNDIVVPSKNDLNTYLGFFITHPELIPEELVLNDNTNYQRFLEMPFSTDKDGAAHFGFNSQGMVLYYPEDSFVGKMEIFIPFSELKGLIKDEFLPANLLRDAKTNDLGLYKDTSF